MAEIPGCVSADWGKDVEQLQKDRKLGDHNHGGVEDVEELDNLTPSATRGACMGPGKGSLSRTPLL